MTERDRLYLGHILDSISAIEAFTSDGRERSSPTARHRARSFANSKSSAKLSSN